MEQEILNDPTIPEGKKMVGTSMLVWSVIRIILLIVEIMCASRGFFEVQSANITALIIGIILAFAIYAGAKALAFLPILGGAIMIFQCVTNGYFDIVGSNDYYMLARVYAGLFILASVVQVAAFAFVLINAKTKAYFNAFARSQKKAVDESKPLK